MTANSHNEWKEALINWAVVDGIYCEAHDTSPHKCLADIVEWEQAIALDPLVSKEARKLRGDGYKDGFTTAAFVISVLIFLFSLARCLGIYMGWWQ